MKLSMQITKLRDVAIIHCVGRIVFRREAAALHRNVHGILGEVRHCILHVGGVTHMDACGLGTLAALCKSTHALGGSLKLTNVNRRLYELLRITGLASVMQFYSSEEDAVRACGQVA